MTTTMTTQPVCRFLAPHVPGGAVYTRLQGKLEMRPSTFEGWGVFEARSAKEMTLAGRATPEAVQSYLARFPRWEIRLVTRLRGRTWLGYAHQNKPAGPAGDPDWFNPADGPVVVQLVEGAQAFDVCFARFDGTNLWFDGLAEDVDGDELWRALEDGTAPDKLKVPALDRCAYSLAFFDRSGPRAENGWKVRWIDQRGEVRTYTILERDLRIVTEAFMVA